MASQPPWISPDARVLPFRGILPSLGSRVFLAAGAVVIGDVVLGDESSVWYNTVIRGDVHRIRIGARTNLQDSVTVHVTAKSHPTTIGDGVTIGHGAIIHGCTLEDGCLVGMGARVLDGAVVGAGAFIGSDTQLVAPVTVGDGAYVGAGSTITEPVPADGLALSRVRQRVIEGWAARQRARMSKKKEG